MTLYLQPIFDTDGYSPFYKYISTCRCARTLDIVLSGTMTTFSIVVHMMYRVFFSEVNFMLPSARLMLSDYIQYGKTLDHFVACIIIH